MSTVAQQPGDHQYIEGLSTSFTSYSTYVAAQAAAIALSAANSSAPVFTARVIESCIAGSPGGSITLAPGTPQNWIIQLASVATYIPQAAAVVAAFATSAANSNASTYVAEVFQIVTGP